MRHLLKLLVAGAAIGFGAMHAHAQTQIQSSDAAALNDANLDCFFEVKDSGKLSTVVRTRDGQGTLKIKKKSGATDELVAQFVACVQGKL